MLKGVLKLPLTLYYLGKEVLLYFYHVLVFKFNNVHYRKMPTLNGKINVVNKGRFTIGENVEFNNSMSSNYVGLFKPCSIYVREEGSLCIGDNSGFSGVSIFCAKRIIIGRFVNCGANVSIWDTDFHPLGFMDRRIHKQDKILKLEIQIGDDVFIGANSIILKGIHVGNRSVIGAGSVVTKSIPEDEVWAGNPARFIRKLTEDNDGNKAFHP